MSNICTRRLKEEPQFHLSLSPEHALPAGVVNAVDDWIGIRCGSWSTIAGDGRARCVVGGHRCRVVIHRSVGRGVIGGCRRSVIRGRHGRRIAYRRRAIVHHSWPIGFHAFDIACCDYRNEEREQSCTFAATHKVSLAVDNVLKEFTGGLSLTVPMVGVHRIGSLQNGLERETIMVVRK